MGLEPTYYGFADRYLTNSAHIHVIWRPVSHSGVETQESTPKWDLFRSCVPRRAKRGTVTYARQRA